MATSSEQSVNPAPLEDLMAAMDVVDTLRHEQSIADRELDQEGRRERLLRRLRELYSAQGIEVPDHILQEGIAALEEERFAYTPIPNSWRTSLARVWVSRARWSKPLGFLLLVAVVFYGIYFAVEVWPQQKLVRALPAQIDSSMAAIINVSKLDDVVDKASDVAADARSLLESGQSEQAQQRVIELQELEQRLRQAYTIRVASRPKQNSGVWRVPPNNPNAKNYYLIVEAVDSNNNPVRVSVLNEESNTLVSTDIWGLRVSESTFFRVAADKQDDGIIQDNFVGEKQTGYLQAEFSIETTGATITEW